MYVCKNSNLSFIILTLDILVYKTIGFDYDKSTFFRDVLNSITQTTR
jgi:hypothetical protein